MNLSICSDASKSGWQHVTKGRVVHCSLRFLPTVRATPSEEMIARVEFTEPLGALDHHKLEVTMLGPAAEQVWMEEVQTGPRLTTQQ